jgi:uncharacterized protein YecE (DUF72 family)
VDQPEIRGVLPLKSYVTSDLAYFRFHGRNKKNWFSSWSLLMFSGKY